jgi:hypothetical protein
MELINATRMAVGYTMGLEPSGRELLVVVMKGSFVLPKAGEAVRLADAQLPLLMADTFSGEPGFSAPVHEVDFAPRKPACDVLLAGSAHASAGTQATGIDVSLRVGALRKQAEVFGERVWQRSGGGWAASAPQPFQRLPLSYDRAFGGVDKRSADEAEHDAYGPNPVGRGWFSARGKSGAVGIEGSPLPNLERAGERVSDPHGTYTPVAFGPLGRGWPQRARFAGTYDERWQRDDFPFLPRDFDERYYQAAPADQQIPHPKAALDVELSGFTPDGPRRFTLPYFEAPVHVFPKRGEREDHIATLDTIVFEPDAERFTMSWRIARPLKKSLHEIAQVLVGRKGREWWQQREQVAFPIPVVMVPVDAPAAEKT